MGNPINQIPLDPVVNPLDAVCGSDSLTGKTYNYTIQSIGEYFTANASSVITTTNIYEVTETAVKTWIQVINTAPVAWVVESGQFATVNRYNQSSVFVGTYALIKDNTSALLIGNGETQVTTASFISLRVIDDSGEANTTSSAGGIAINKTKDGVDLPFKGFANGTNINIADDGDILTINMNGTLGEINTLGNVGTGEPLAGTKSASEVKVKSISVVGGKKSSTSTDLTITNWSKETKTASWELVDSDKFTTFQINSGSAVVVTVPATLDADFEAGFIQIGTGDITFVAGAGATILGSYNAINGQLQSAWIETEKATPTNIILQGQIKTI